MTEIVSSFFQGAALLFHPLPVLYASLGVFVGLIIGVIPGLGGLATLALLLPTAYALEMKSALALILGAYSALYFGGSITAILFNTPGTGEQVVTTFDGYPLTKMGQGKRALGASAASSALGGLLGVFGLMLSIPLARTVIYYIRPPEMFMLSLLGVVAIGVVNAKTLCKGLISGAFGLMLSFVGYDPISGTPRFSFGLLSLFDGLNVTALTLGLFAIAEMVDLFGKGTSIASNVEEDKGRTSQAEEGGTDPGHAPAPSRVLDGVLDTFRHWRTLIEGSLIGVSAGILPGMGGTVAMFLAYARAKMRSKNPELFGKGAIEGVIGPESSNNAKEGGSLVPTLIFGIPGSSGMAIFMGILLILGLEPGPSMVKENLHIVYYMAWIIALTSILASVFGLTFVSLVSKAAYLRPSVIVPVLISVSFLGSFVDKGSMTLIMTTFISGGIGFWLAKMGYSNAGLILGFVMGPLVEKYLYLSLQAYGGRFVLRPISMLIIFLGILMILSPYRRRKRVKRP